MDEDEQILSFHEDSEDEADWEEVAVPSAGAQPQPQQDIAEYDPYGSVADAIKPTENIEITIHARPKADESTKKKGISHAERLIRIDCHKIHTITLLANGFVRNKWLNDELLHARLMSLTPLSLQNAFAMIHKSRVPDANKRGRLFEAAITRLAEWWAEFFEVLPEGHLRSRTFDEVAAELAVAEARARKAEEKARRSRKGKGKQRAQRDEEEDDDNDDDSGEIVRSVKSLMKHALMRAGSRDVSAQLFTALCRALGVPARLVVSLQSMPWQAGVGKPKPPAKRKAKGAKGKGKAVDGAGGRDGEEVHPDADMEEVEIPEPRVDVKGKGKAKEAVFPGDGQRMDGSSSITNTAAPGPSQPVIKLRKTKTKGQTLGSSFTPTKTLSTPDPLTTPPVFWTEVFSRPDGRWMPVDPIRTIVNKRKVFDPSPPPSSTGPTPRVRQENRMVYVVAFEEDGYAKDVTPRYAREYGAKVAKVQGAERGGGGKGRKVWWERVAEIVRRPYRLQRDDVEDDELQVNQMTEAMPTTMTGFKDHPLYALARHLKRDEIIHPLTELGKFRGEPVYPRANVIPLKAAENWMRSGRKVTTGSQPMKWVKQRATTIHKRRAVELALSEQRDRRAANGDADEAGGMASEEGVMQGLYALNQTEVYRPDPVVNGKVPKNDFGNIDLYVPSMLPAGAVHVPYKGTAKIARQLRFDYAEAVTGFEFRKRKANPIITGVVIAAENEGALLEAYWEAEHDAAEKERVKKQERVLKRWTRLIHGLRIRERLQAQYAGRLPAQTTVTVDVVPEVDRNGGGGGFLAVADDVVQPYALPKLQHFHTPPPLSAPAPPGDGADGDTSTADGSDVGARVLAHMSLEVVGDDDDGDGDAEMEEVAPAVAEDAPDPLVGAPRTMAQLAEEAARDRRREDRARSVDADADEDGDEDAEMEEYVPDRGAKAAVASGGAGRATRASVRGQPKPKPAPRPRPKARAQPARPAARRVSRKRAREPDSEDETASAGAIEEESELSDAPSDAAPIFAPAKRAGRAAKAAPAPAPAPTTPAGTGRTLRARRTKTAAELEEERAREAAYRRAVAE